MISYPKNYEEAKVIIKNSVHDDYEKHIMKVSKIRFGLVTAIAAIAAIGIGALAHTSAATFAVLPISALASFAAYSPMIIQRKTNKQIQNGKYFEGKTEEQIIDTATKYADQYNDFAKSRQR